MKIGAGAAEEDRAMPEGGKFEHLHLLGRWRAKITISQSILTLCLL